jgi:hypothetical protein
MNRLHFFSFFLLALFFSCQSNPTPDTSAAEEELRKEKEALMNEREKLLNEREKMMEESKNEKTTSEPSTNSSSIARIKDIKGTACVIGEMYTAEIKDKDGYTNVRKSPSSSSQIVTQINEGEFFAVTITNENWLKVIAPDGSKGYIYWDRVKVHHMGQ